MANEKLFIDIAKRAREWNELLEAYYPNMPRITLGEFLLAAPAVEAVVVVHAKWESVQNGKGCCSNCHRLDSIDDLATHCRYCGAKMDGERKG